MRRGAGIAKPVKILILFIFFVVEPIYEELAIKL